MKNCKLELSLAFALAAMLLACAAPQPVDAWWSAAFSPLCDGILTDSAAGDPVLRSKLWALFLRLRGLF